MTAIDGQVALSAALEAFERRLGRLIERGFLSHVAACDSPGGSFARVAAADLTRSELAELASDSRLFGEIGVVESRAGEPGFVCVRALEPSDDTGKAEERWVVDRKGRKKRWHSSAQVYGAQWGDS